VAARHPSEGQWKVDPTLLYRSNQMSRRKNSGQSAAGFGLVLVAVIFAVGSALIHAVGPVACVIVIVGIIAGVIWYKAHRRAVRIAYLRNKYGDEEIVQRILRRNYWQGQTAEQLRDSLGDPASVDGGLLKTRKREVWKYHPTGENRYRLRITLDDDVVADHFQKN